MKVLLVLFLTFAFTLADSDCYRETVNACGAGGADIVNCNSAYGNIDKIAYDITSFANKHISHNFKYILYSTHFDNYEKNRDGFAKMFRKLSDEAWSSAIGLIKYMAKRNVTMNFEASIEDPTVHPHDSYELFELHSLSKAVDVQKSFANEANRIHGLAKSDAEVMSFMENTFVHQLRDSVRDLVGYTNDLKRLLKNKKSAALDIHLFDLYLEKIYS